MTAPQAEEIRSRIASLHTRNAEYLKKIASGEIRPDQDLEAKWPEIQAGAQLMHGTVGALNGISPDDPKRPALEATLLSQLQSIGMFLAPASHPPFTPPQLSPAQVEEMDRIAAAIANLSFGDRKKAQPVKLVGPPYSYALIHLPVPIMLKGQPNAKIYLVAMTGGRFANGLSLIELTADKNGMAGTHWVSIGEAVGACDISIHSEAAIERQDIRIEVVSPSLNVFEGLPKPEVTAGAVPHLKAALGNKLFKLREAAE